MLHEHTTGSPHRQRSAFPNLPNSLPEAKIVSGLPLTAQQLSRVLGGKPAGDEWWDEGYLVGDKAWIDDRDAGGIYIRCRDIKGLMRRAMARLGTPDGIVRRYSPTLLLYVNAPVAKGKRSLVIFKIGMELAQAGASAAEIECALGASKCWQSKWGNNRRSLKAEVTRIIRKAWRSRHGH
jgi:hypothetical protein